MGLLSDMFDTIKAARNYQQSVDLVAKLATRDDHEGQYYCGICGWVSIAIFPNCHATQQEKGSEE